MTEIATQGQLRMSYLRWALVTVPAIVLIGSLMGLLSNSGYGNRWFAALDLPPVTPPGWVFVTVWPILYICLGLSLAMILHARGAKGRRSEEHTSELQSLMRNSYAVLYLTQKK